MRNDLHAEWLEADGLGGFASGTVSGIRTRRYHALLLPATTPPGGRMVLVNGFEAWVTTARGRFALTSQRYGPDVTHPDGASRIVGFDRAPWPRWTFDLPDGTRIEQQLFVPHEHTACVLSWSASGTRGPIALEVRPLLSGRDYHSLHRENGAFRFDAHRGPSGRIIWSPYDGVPPVEALTNGSYEHAPEWFRNFVYDAERDRGLDFVEDLASPGSFRWNLATADALCVLATAGNGLGGDADAAPAVATLRRRETRRRAAFASPLHRSADAYIVRRGAGRTIVAGYPWFTDWGRDTFISLRGLCLATGRLDDARRILVEWASAVSEGMLPNRFADAGDTPEFNSVDASLWYVVAVGEFLAAAEGAIRIGRADRRALDAAIEQILTGYARGTRYGIRAHEDGLLACGVPGVQLTWMDARVGDRVITPRIGKPVEIQALWINALNIGARLLPWCADLAARATLSFDTRFWNEDLGYFHDVVDVDHVHGTADQTLRPNQVLALGGLPLALVNGERAVRALRTIESRLLTPIGLRSLSPDDAAYVGRYRGGVSERDGAYHQGTVWPWLLGAFVDAWLRQRRDEPRAGTEARKRFLEPLLRHLDDAGLGHVSEIADGDAPFTPAGCPFQAWSAGELIRIDAAIAAAGSSSALLSTTMEALS